MITISLLVPALMLFGSPFEAAAKDATQGRPPMQLAVQALENRFIATGFILEVRPAPSGKGIKKFRFKIEKTARIEGFADFSAEYLGKEVEVASQIPLPPSLKPGATISVVLRVAGDEWHQSLFLVEVIDHESQR